MALDQLLYSFLVLLYLRRLRQQVLSVVLVKLLLPAQPVEHTNSHTVLLGHFLAFLVLDDQVVQSVYTLHSAHLLGLVDASAHQAHLFGEAFG